VKKSRQPGQQHLVHAHSCRVDEGEVCQRLMVHRPSGITFSDTKKDPADSRPPLIQSINGWLVDLNQAGGFRKDQVPGIAWNFIWHQANNCSASARMNSADPVNPYAPPMADLTPDRSSSDLLEPVLGNVAWPLMFHFKFLTLAPKVIVKDARTHDGTRKLLCLHPQTRNGIIKPYFSF